MVKKIVMLDDEQLKLLMEIIDSSTIYQEDLTEKGAKAEEIFNELEKVLKME